MHINKFDNYYEIKVPTIDKIEFIDIKNIKPNTSGIYFIHNKDKQLIYIGKSTDIKNRLNKHKLGIGNGFFKQRPQVNPTEVCYIKILESKYDLDALEQIYITLFNPYRNYDGYYLELESKEIVYDESMRDMLNNVGD